MQYASLNSSIPEMPVTRSVRPCWPTPAPAGQCIGSNAVLRVQRRHERGLMNTLVLSGTLRDPLILSLSKDEVEDSGPIQEMSGSLKVPLVLSLSKDEVEDSEPVDGRE